MEIPIYQVDAFTSHPFKGNPAAVCLLDRAHSDEWMQQVATEMNLSETAFLVKRDDGFSLRWFTPAIEVPLCGHATLASAHTLWETSTIGENDEAHFHTASGLLKARRAGGRIELDFPAIPSEPGEISEEARAILGVDPLAVFVTRGTIEKGYLIELGSENEVRNARPDFSQLGRAISGGVIITAQSSTDEFDFVSRYFAVYAGIDEDPVTGSAHCALTPYWSRRLGKTEMIGYQASRRGGVVGVRLNGDRVNLFGEAVTILRGTLLH
jgi:PhzF family phenazine biosynthesis protein